MARDVSIDKLRNIGIMAHIDAGKTTLTMKLHQKYNFNYYNFDMLLDSLEESFRVLQDHNDDKYVTLLNEMVKRSLDDAKNYGVSTIYEYIFTPKQLSMFEYKDKVEIYFLANLDADDTNIREDMKKYSKPFDWPAYVGVEDIERNVKEILEKNELLKNDCQKYGFNLINTSREDRREVILDQLVEEIKKNSN